VTTIPYFNTVPVHAIPMDAATAEQVNGMFDQYNQALQALVVLNAIDEEEAEARFINFNEGQNAPIIVDTDLTDISGILIQSGMVDEETANLLAQLRQANTDDLLLLPSMNVIGTLADASNPMSIMGVAVPLPDELVLTKKEQERVHTAMESYNATIQALASQHDLAFLDANMLLKQVAQDGVPYDAGVLTSEYVTGG